MCRCRMRPNSENVFESRGSDWDMKSSSKNEIQLLGPIDWEIKSSSEKEILQRMKRHAWGHVLNSKIFKQKCIKNRITKHDSFSNQN